MIYLLIWPLASLPSFTAPLFPQSEPFCFCQQSCGRFFFLLQVLGSLILESWKIRWPASPATHYARPIRTPFNTMMNFVDVLFLFYYTTFQLHWPSFTRHDSDITSFNSYYRPTKELYRENWESESPSNLPQLHHQQVSGQRSKLQILMLSNTSCTWGPLRNLLYSQLPFPVSVLFLDEYKQLWIWMSLIWTTTTSSLWSVTKHKMILEVSI